MPQTSAILGLVGLLLVGLALAITLAVALTAWGLPEERWNDANAIVDPDGLGPRIFIQKVPEAKTVKNRIHLDVRVSASPHDKDRASMQTKADELVAAGATQQQIFDHPSMGYWIVMADPEGNEFCIV